MAWFPYTKATNQRQDNNDKEPAVFNACWQSAWVGPVKLPGLRTPLALECTNEVFEQSRKLIPSSRNWLKKLLVWR